jgi:hypothetical protein
VAAGDLELLLLGVAGEPDDLHAVEKAGWMVSVRLAVAMNSTFDRS